VAATRVLRSRLGETDALGRLGGDEFAVLLWDESGKQNAADVTRPLNGNVL
jgi:PleD family two-component response regulator